MSDVILTNWTVYYADDQAAAAGMKQIKWTGAGAPETTTNTVNELYSALADLFSISAQNNADDTIPMRAITPTVYEVGAFDAGDLEPWFIDPDSVEHLTGSSLSTVGWTRDLPADGTGDIGILMVQCSSTGFNLLAGDIGDTCSHADGDAGVILHVDTANYRVWIRPNDNTLANDFNSTTGGIITAGTTPFRTATQETAVVGTTGERVWANIYTIGGIYSSSNLYVAQNYTKYTSWWSVNHLDRLFLTSDDYDTGLIDYGYLSTYAREYGYLYDHFQADVSSGGRNPIPLATSADVNNTTAIATIAALTGITFTFGATLEDINNGSGNRPYNVTIDCGGNTISDFYEYTKWATRRTATTPLSTSLYQDAVTTWGLDGEQYWGTGEIIVNLQTITIAPTEGDTITGGTSGATGVLVAYHTSPTNFLVVRDVRGTFEDSEIITDEGTGNVTAAAASAVENITLSKSAPFGTFAGTQFFGTRGVHIHNMAGADANNYSLIDSTDTAQDPPTSVPITVSNTESGDRVSVFRASDTSGTIEKDVFTSDAVLNGISDDTFVVQETISTSDNDTPSSGILRVVDEPNEADHRFRFSSWLGSTFTLVTTDVFPGPAVTIDSAGTDPTISFTATDAKLANVLAGDIVRNTGDTPDSWAQIISVTLDSGTTYDVVHTPLQGGTNNYWIASDGYEFNTLPVLYDGSDTAYVPYLDETATGTTTSTSVTYASTRNITTRVRKKGIQPYINNISPLNTDGYSTSVTRIPDTIAT